MNARPGITWGFYGWKIAATLAITETVSWGILYYAFSVFLVPMQQETGWSLALLTGAYSLALLLSGVSAPVVGRLLDRHGPRALMTFGSLLGAACLVAWSRLEDVVGYYLAWAGIGIAMSLTLYEPAFATLTRWFDRDRGRALLMVTIAAGFASTIFLPVSGMLVARFPWRDAVLILAAILAMSTVPLHALVLRRRPEDLALTVDGRPPGEDESATRSRPVGHGITLHRVLREPTFWWLAGAFVLQSFAGVAVGVILIPYLTDRDADPAFAATATGLIGAAQVLARILATMFGKHVSAVTLTAAVFALQALALGVLIGWQERTGILLAVLMLGAGRGAVTLMRPQLIADFYGRTHFGVISGTLASFLTLAGSLAPIGIGLAYGAIGSYTPLLWAMATMSILATVTMLLAGQQRRRTMLNSAQHPDRAYS